MEEATSNITRVAAAIDLGSNTFRLLVAEINGHGHSTLWQKNVTTCLGAGLTATAGFTPETMNRALAVLREFKSDLARYDIDCCRCCGTEALRTAVNSKVFLELVKKNVGFDIEILSGAEEAGLCWRGVLAGIGKSAIPAPLLLIDVGGSSTELIYLRQRGATPVSVSLPAGAALFTEYGAVGSLAARAGEFTLGLADFIKKSSLTTEGLAVIGTGGTATALAVLDLGLSRYDGERVQGHRLTNRGIVAVAERVAALTGEAREFLPGLEQGRGRIIMAGIEIYQEILATIGVDVMIVSDFGLLEGIMLSCLNRDLRLSSYPARA